MAMIEVNGVELAVETFGSAADPAILLVHGASASMLCWETELCARIANRGRFVIRYDNRDTGLSVSYPPGRPGYSLADLAVDAIGVLYALGVARPHLVVHGEQDPVFPLPHGQALRDAIPGAELLVLEKAGHEVPAPLWEVFADALTSGPSTSDTAARQGLDH